ncbi:response regulator [Iningainema tapete]|uniref:Response regulator n=1 Tax=Iningainema tapete BLCC-T55 TaxID=2748662 RepID=A0A8J7C683_9CYAN|nr:response regulator [Iningainema tapete]MBD2773999.1 response regulator [Iningainema tapete BLCC-T55]
MTAKQILVIDDEDDIRKLIQTCLEIMGGWQVLSASSGSEGLHLAQTAQPDAILLDVMMPEMDGPTTFQKLQANPATKDIPVILLTAKGRTTESHLFAELGVTGVLNKPFNPHKLADQVAAALGSSV